MSNRFKSRPRTAMSIQERMAEQIGAEKQTQKNK